MIDLKKFYQQFPALETLDLRYLEETPQVQRLSREVMDRLPAVKIEGKIERSILSGNAFLICGKAGILCAAGLDVTSIIKCTSQLTLSKTRTYIRDPESDYLDCWPRVGEYYLGTGQSAPIEYVIEVRWTYEELTLKITNMVIHKRTKLLSPFKVTKWSKEVLTSANTSADNQLADFAAGSSEVKISGVLEVERVCQLLGLPHPKDYQHISGMTTEITLTRAEPPRYEVRKIRGRRCLTKGKQHCNEQTADVVVDTSLRPGVLGWTLATYGLS